MYYGRAQSLSGLSLDYLLLFLTAALFLAFTPPAAGKAIPVPAPFPADNPLQGASPAPAIPYNPPPPVDALGIPPIPLSDIDKDWFLSQLVKPQPENNCVFYCHITNQAQRWVKAHPPLRTIWETYPAVIFQDDNEPRKYFLEADEPLPKGETPNAFRYAALSSQAYASECRGTVYLLLDEKQGKKPGCIWDTEESKEIKRDGGAANKIITIILEAGTITEKSRSEDNFRSGPQPAQPCPPPGSNAKRALSCDAPSSTTTRAKTTLATTPTAKKPGASSAVPSPICTYREDPDQNRNGGQCICSNSVTLPQAASTGSNTGAHYNPCPMTSIPPMPTTKPPAPKPTNTPQFGFTTTKYNSNVIGCQSGSKTQVAGFPITDCEGSSVTLKIAPTLSVQAGKQKQNVGELTGTALYTSVSSALDKLCPSPTSSGAATTCTAGTVEVDQITYLLPEVNTLGQGALQFEVKDSFYNTDGLRQAMIRSAALTAQHSANGTNCYTRSPEFCEDAKCRGGQLPVTLCNAVDFAGVQHYDGKGDVSFIDAEWTFEVPGGNSGDFTCSNFQEGLQVAMEALVALPEFAFLDLGLGELVVALCEAAASKPTKGG
jgi:hypothetical protein